MQRITLILFLLFCYSPLVSCSDNIKMEVEKSELFGKFGIDDRIGIRIITYNQKLYYALESGKLSIVSNLPTPLKPSHQNPELSSDGYNFLPNNIDCKYQGPQLKSPDGNTTVASCIRKNTRPHGADTFVVFQNRSQNIIDLVSMDKPLTIEGIAWSPKSDIFTVLASQTIVPFQWNILRVIAGHPTNSSDYFLFFYNKNGQFLFKNKIISSLVDGTVQVVWMPKG